MEKTCPFVAPLNPNIVELTVGLPQVLGVTPLVLYLEASCFVVNLQYLAQTSLETGDKKLALVLHPVEHVVITG